jgi:Phasin protein
LHRRAWSEGLRPGDPLGIAAAWPVLQRSKKPGIAGRRLGKRRSLSMAKSIQPVKSREPKGVGSASPAARRAAPTAEDKPARSEARPEAPKAPDQRRPAEPVSESAHPAPQPPPTVPATLDPAQPAAAEGATGEPAMAEPAPSESPIDEPTPAQPAPAASAIDEPAMATPAEVGGALAEPPPALASSVDEPPALAAAAADLPEPLAAAAELALASAAMPWPSSSLVEGSVRIRSEMIAFTWRQTEHGLALGRALLASRSLPELLALQTAYLSETLERTLAHSLELARLSTDMLRAGVQPPQAD